LYEKPFYFELSSPKKAIKIPNGKYYDFLIYFFSVGSETFFKEKMRKMNSNLISSRKNIFTIHLIV